MLLNDSSMRPTDRYLKSLLQESYDQKSKKQVLRLPCQHFSFELDKPQDVFVQCPTCKKSYQLLWSAVNKKVREI